MCPKTTLMIALFVGAPTSADVTDARPATIQKQKLRVTGQVLTGFDSNVDQSAKGSPPSTVLQISGDADYARRVGSNIVASGRLGLWSDAWEAESLESRFGMGGSFALSSYVIGAGKLRGLGPSGSVFPRLRLQFTAAYDFGFRLTQTSESSPPPQLEEPLDATDTPDEEDEEEEEEEENDMLEATDGSVLNQTLAGDSNHIGHPTFALREPFHRVFGEVEARFEPGPRTELELAHRAVRALLKADPGDSARHYTQWDVGLRIKQRLHRRVSVGGGYAYSFRDHDERRNSAGELLHYQTHYTEAFVRYQRRPWSLRLRHQFRYRLANADGRDRTRHTMELLASWRFYETLFAVMELTASWEDRIGRPDRDWQRYAAIAGLRFRL